MLMVENEVREFPLQKWWFAYMERTHKPYLMETHDMTGRPKTGDEMFDLMKADKEMIEGKYDCKVLAWCADE